MSDNSDAWKNWIARWVAHKLFPNNGGIDENRNISGNAKAHAPTIAVEINFLAHQVADKYSLTWDNVVPSDVEKLNTVKDLVDLIVKHLT